MAPLVSVVIPSYNHAEFLETTLGSVFSQTYRPLELVVVDDGSKDESREILRELMEKAPLDQVCLIEQPNAGAHNAIMCGIEASTGEYVALLNSDDFFHPERIEKLLPSLQGGQHRLAFSGVSFVDGSGEDLPKHNPWPTWYRTCLDRSRRSPTVGLSLLVDNYSVSSGNFVFERSLYEDLGGFSSHRFTHDWDFLIRSIHYSEPVFHPEPLLSYRIHETNTTETVRNRLRSEAGDALRRFVALTESEATPNPLAPSPSNWPRYFDSWADRAELHFEPDSNLLEFWRSVSQPDFEPETI